MVQFRELLKILNASFLYAHCPRISGDTTIILIQKTGKLDNKVASYQPNILTSYIVHFFKRMVTDHFYYITESKYLFSRYQAGFQKWCSCEDRILRFVKTIEDGFKKKPVQSLQRCLETKVIATHARHGCSSYYPPLVTFLSQRLMRTTPNFKRFQQ